jgi:hypothetical protein
MLTMLSLELAVLLVVALSSTSLALMLVVEVADDSGEVAPRIVNGLEVVAQQALAKRAVGSCSTTSG